MWHFNVFFSTAIGCLVPQIFIAEELLHVFVFSASAGLNFENK